MNALPPSDRPRHVSEVREGEARARSDLVPALWRKASQGRARKMRQGQGGRHSLRRQRPGTVPRVCARQGAGGATGRGRTRARARAAAHIHIEGGTVCEPCRVARRDREREQYAARRIAGLCGRCGTPAPSDTAYCDRCARSAAKRSRKKAKNTRSRQRYVQRRVRRLCIDCAAPSQGASRCPPCARRSWARSGEHRGLPVLPPRVTVIEIASGVNHGTWDRWEDVVVCLAFAKLSRDQVELIPDM